MPKRIRRRPVAAPPLDGGWHPGIAYSFARLIGLVVLVLALCAACATLTAPPTMSEAERCARFGGSYSNGSCRTGAP